MLNSLGFDSLEALSASVIPDSIKGTSVLGLEDGQSEADALALTSKPSPARTSCSRPSSARVTTAPTRRRRSCATCWKTRPGTPPTPRTSRKFPRAASSAAELPDPDQRPHRPADRQRLAAGRSHRRRRSHDLLQTPEQEQGQPQVLRLRRIATRRPSTCCAPVPSRWASTWSSADERELTDVTRVLRRPAAIPGKQW
jgi:hypothetical protein